MEKKYTFTLKRKPEKKKKPKNEEEFYAGVLFEIGRILLEKPEIFPKDILEIFENQNIL